MRSAQVIFALSALLLLAGPGSARAGGCASPASPPGSDESELEFESATACLIDEERAGLGLAEVNRAVRLDRAAKLYARDMVARRFFAHISPDGADLLDRVRGSRYLRGWNDYRLGEVLGWGTGSLSLPSSIMRAWRESPGHRQIIWGPAYRDVGIGVTSGVPTSGEPGATYAVMFARRRRG
jgi:uncharacterized protein YkwD